MQQEHPPIRITIRPAYLVSSIILILLLCVVGGTTLSVPSPTSTTSPTNIWLPAAPGLASILYQMSASTQGWKRSSDGIDGTFLTFSSDFYQRPNSDPYSCFYSSTLQIMFRQADPFGTSVHIEVSEHKAGCPSLG